LAGVTKSLWRHAFMFFSVSLTLRAVEGKAAAVAVAELAHVQADNTQLAGRIDVLIIELDQVKKDAAAAIAAVSAAGQVAASMPAEKTRAKKAE
jgi:hypothetical protein